MWIYWCRIIGLREIFVLQRGLTASIGWCDNAMTLYYIAFTFPGGLPARSAKCCSNCPQMEVSQMLLRSQEQALQRMVPFALADPAASLIGRAQIEQARP